MVIPLYGGDRSKSTQGFTEKESHYDGLSFSAAGHQSMLLFYDAFPPSWKYLVTPNV